jgi:hypothetical protein
MPERRSPRKLRDVSHLFLSGAAGSRSAAARSTVRIWIAVVGASLNRAHCAAGTAAALARQGMCVSLLEVCRGLPNIGYYFGMEPASYIGPTLDRAELVSGTWNGAIRYCFSADPAALERYGGEDLSLAFPHAIVEAFPYPRERDAARFLATLERAAAAVSDGEVATGCPPDAIIAAGCGGSAERVRALTAGMRDAFPHAAIFLVTDEAAAARPSEADESLLVSDDLRTSWARRTPPVDHLFDELAAGILQVVSQRRKRGGDHAANG